MSIVNNSLKLTISALALSFRERLTQVLDLITIFWSDRFTLTCLPVRVVRPQPISGWHHLLQDLQH